MAVVRQASRLGAAHHRDVHHPACRHPDVRVDADVWVRILRMMANRQVLRRADRRHAVPGDVEDLFRKILRPVDAVGGVLSD